MPGFSETGVLGRVPHKRGLRSGDFISYGMNGHSGSEDAMAQQVRAEQMPARSRAWLEAECLAVARRTAGGKGVERVMVGTSGTMGDRFGLVTASARSDPSLMCGAADGSPI